MSDRFRIKASGEDLSVAARLVASVGQRAWLTSPDLFVSMFDAVDWGDFAPTPNEAFDWAQAHKFAAIAVKNDNARRDELLRSALRLYKLARPAKEYELTHYAEALILAGQYRAASEQLDSVAVHKRGAFWLQRKAQALSGLSVHDQARARMDEAIAALTDTRLLPVFHVDRFRIRLASGDVNAREDLDVAIELLPIGDGLREQLEAERAKL